MAWSRTRKRVPQRAHYLGSYDRSAEKVRRAAYANPLTRCARCGRTLREHPPHKNGKPARWQAGHVRPGEVGGALRAEASTCNMAHGARLRVARQKAKARARKRSSWTWTT